MSKRLAGNLALAATAGFAMLWAVARAWVQSITIDEADTYLTFVGRAAPYHWWAAANNHILNSALMRMFTLVFGVSHLTVRAPALIGAAIYIAASLWICTLLTDDVWIRWPLFVSLVYNPFVFDYLVAARGYGMALAFLMCAIAAAMTARARAGAWCSFFLGLCFVANFSFAIAGLATGLVMFLWIGRLRDAAAWIFPGAAVAVVLALPTVLGWHQDFFIIGTNSLREMLSSLAQSSLFEVNPEVANPLVYAVFHGLKDWLFPALGVAVLMRIVVLWLRRAQLKEHRDRRLAELAGWLALTMALTVAIHWLVFRIRGVPLPEERTALYLVPLGTIAAGALLAVALPLQRPLLAVFWAFALYFLTCSRLSYFKEWKYDAEGKQLYQVVAWYNHAYCVTEVPSGWYYASSLNFYRVASGRETLEPFKPLSQYPPGKDVYVLQGRFDQPFMEQQRLQEIWRGPVSDAVVAVRPGLASSCK